MITAQLAAIKADITASGDMNTCVRNATRLEKLLSTGNGTTGTVTAGILGFEGNVNYQMIEEARA